METLGKKKILVLGRRDHTEAMRVAAGLTVAGHEIRLVFMTKSVEETAENELQAELLELSDIVPETTVPSMANNLNFLNIKGLANAISNSDSIINV
jgi:hypothetical protein